MGKVKVAFFQKADHNSLMLNKNPNSSQHGFWVGLTLIWDPTSVPVTMPTSHVSSHGPGTAPNFRQRNRVSFVMISWFIFVSFAFVMKKVAGISNQFQLTNQSSRSFIPHYKSWISMVHLFCMADWRPVPTMRKSPSRLSHPRFSHERKEGRRAPNSVRTIWEILNFVLILELGYALNYFK